MQELIPVPHPGPHPRPRPHPRPAFTLKIPVPVPVPLLPCPHTTAWTKQLGGGNHVEMACRALAYQVTELSTLHASCITSLTSISHL